ncbi:hypothetical protein CEXT_532751 [Caerostris extrusa]|uniref:Uncharacterized protein n=1 Tax=Caerostris extrusa TaxID=172846 RepID=A0AAV4PGV3_CAEEX|nr:hypothetical protein CEXT_532751 [Caerostris extrusa]
MAEDTETYSRLVKGIWFPPFLRGPADIFGYVPPFPRASSPINEVLKDSSRGGVGGFICSRTSIPTCELSGFLLIANEAC